MKQVLAAASHLNKKYFFEPEFGDLPPAVQKELRIAVTMLAEDLKCNTFLGFYQNGDVFVEAEAKENDILVPIALEDFKAKHHELLKSLRLWYISFKTPEGIRYFEKMR